MYFPAVQVAVLQRNIGYYFIGFCRQSKFKFVLYEILPSIHLKGFHVFFFYSFVLTKVLSPLQQFVYVVYRTINEISSVTCNACPLHLYTV